MGAPTKVPSSLVNTGTSGAVVPLLSGNNSWSGTAAFGSAASTIASFNVAGSSTIRGIANTTALFGAGVASGSVTGANVQLGSINGNSPFIAGSLYGASDATASDLLFLTNATERMRILAGGNLQMASNQAIIFAGTGAATTRTNLGLGALATLNAVSSATLPTGSVVDSVVGTYTANTTLTTVLPQDDTIPQNTEGTQVISVSITPKSTTNKLRIRIQGYGSTDQPAGIVWAIFSSLSANAIGAGIATVTTGSYLTPFDGEVEFVPATTSAVTISLRVGPGVSPRTCALNGNVGQRYLGGVSSTTMTVEEIKA